MARFEDLYHPYHPFGSRTINVTVPQTHGTDVAILQGVFNLMASVMTRPIGTAVTVTGTYDLSTGEAIRELKKYFRIGDDTIAGFRVYFVYDQGVGDDTTFGGPVFGSRTLALGSRGGDVAILQNRLNAFRYSSILGGAADGTFDDATRSAVAAFQHDANRHGDRGLSVTGIVDDATFDALWIYTFLGGRAIFTGRNGFDVVFIQVLLKDMGLYTGDISGLYDDATRHAVMALQRNSGIPADGVVGPETMYQLGLRNQNPAPSPLPVFPISEPGPVLGPCCVILTPTRTSNRFVGGTVWAVEQAPSAFSLAFNGVNLPPPSTIGPGFTYTGRVTKPDGSFFLADLQSCGEPVPTFTGAIDSGASGPIPIDSTVDIFAGPTGASSGVVVLQGTLTDCLPVPTVSAVASVTLPATAASMPAAGLSPMGEAIGSSGPSTVADSTPAWWPLDSASHSV